MRNVTESLNERTNHAQWLKAQGRHGEALEVLQEMVDSTPGNVAVLHNYAAVLAEAGRNREAVDIFKQAFAKGLNAPESWLVYARALSGVQDFIAAETAFMHLLKLKPLDHDAHRELAQLIWMQTGDREKALRFLNKAIEENPSVAPLHTARAQVFGQTGDSSAEYAFMKEAARLSGEPHFDMAACNSALADEKFDEALAYGERAARALPDDPNALSSYVQALLANGQAELAERITGKLRESQPVNQFFIALQATAWRMLGDARYEEVYNYKKFVRPSPLDTPPGWKTLQNYLNDLIAALDHAHRFKTHPFYQSVRHGSQISSIVGSDNPALRAFPTAAAGPVRRFVEAAGAGTDPLRSRNLGGFRLFSTWSISLPPNGFHVNHVHPEGWLSSACHLRPAEKDSDDEHAGWLKFGEPGVPTSPSLPPERFVEPEPGVMVIFPSYMWHGTVGFSKGDARLTVAADITPAES
ncbi:MAG: tetratricopeptide repeat protein [Marinicaulis sp.]|nr:tetratricopeptide repeat protein [Marinicaulis sp.]NNL88354.1 tetratricopeptide repeat protein [Marinicaulis sp.]